MLGTIMFKGYGSYIIIGIMVIGIFFGVAECRSHCPTVTGKRESGGFWYGDHYLDLSNNTSEAVSSKVYNRHDVNDRYCG